MKIGDIVCVYEDPITCLKVEGLATLKRPVPTGLRNDTPGCEEWFVCFNGEFQRYRRAINIINH